ncbi:MAG: ATP-binding protein [Lachnospiraceae bacterium]|nr:ATP-binding protein [Lachnospiraceae bacterium]
MAKVIAICGKICSGKSYYAAGLKEKENAVILSCDELTKDLFDNDLGEKHDEVALRIWTYFKKKSVELVKVGCTVILDWGFWSRENRKSLKEFYREQNIPCEWHYIDVADETWKQNIEERNCRVLNGEGGSDYYLDEGLMGKLNSLWEEPASEEVDVWYRLVRE